MSKCGNNDATTTAETSANPTKAVENSFTLSNSTELLGSPNKNDKDIDDLVKNVVLHIKNKKLSQGQLNILADALGESISDKIFEETVHLRGAYKDLEKTSKLNSYTYLKQKPPVLIRFLCTVTTFNINQFGNNTRKSCFICILIEHLEGIRNATYIGPFSFAGGLVKWNFSRSKASHSLDSCSRACGSVTTMKNFFKKKEAGPNFCDMAEDIEIFADNTQWKGRTSRVKEDATTLIGIATNVVVIQSNFNSFIQQDIRLSPENWLYNTDFEETVCDKIKGLEHELNEKVFRPYRYDYQNKLLKEIQSELWFDDNGVPCDNASMSLIIDKDGYLVCPKCCEATR